MHNKLKSYDPSNGKLIDEVSLTTIESISSIVEESKQAQVLWSQLSIDHRIEYIIKASKRLQRRQEAIGTLLSKEMGKPLNSGIGEVMGCASDVKTRAHQVKDALKTVTTRGYGMKTELQYKPLGVCAVITPWNYPVSMAHWLIIPALVAGNTVVFKPSEETPLVAQAYVDVFNEVLPKNVLQIVHGADEQGKELVKSDVDLIAFTGSKAVGKDIMKNSAQSLKRMIMELGGNDPLIVMADADIDQAAQFAIGNSFSNSGQMCISTERIFVDEKIAEKFEHQMAAYSKYYKVGPWSDKSANLGPIINQKQRDHIIRHIKDAVDKGARILAGGTEHPDRYILPTVLSNITSEMDMSHEETFGPVASIRRFTDVDEAIQLANDSDFGLGAVIFGHKNVNQLANQLEAGMIGINQGIGGIGDTPWVGAKQSGFGFHGSPDGHKQFTQVRVITGPDN
jgi:acyl-CoA reductase-like NAD-dependent aldehyde dehydrogenase